MLVLVGTHFLPSGTYFCILIEHTIEWIFRINELKIENWNLKFEKKLNFARENMDKRFWKTRFFTKIPKTFASFLFVKREIVQNNAFLKGFKLIERYFIWPYYTLYYNWLIFYFSKIFVVSIELIVVIFIKSKCIEFGRSNSPPPTAPSFRPQAKLGK